MPAAKDKAHKTALPKKTDANSGAAPLPASEPLPLADDEGTKVAPAELEASAQTAFVRRLYCVLVYWC